MKPKSKANKPQRPTGVALRRLVRPIRVTRLECPKKCGHTEHEHKAFDAGLWAGENGLEESACILRGELLEAWLTGHSVGKLNRPNNRS